MLGTNYGMTPARGCVLRSYRCGEGFFDGLGGRPLRTKHTRGSFNSEDWHGLTPLSMAISRHQRGFIDLLLEDKYNLDPIARPTSADTIIHFAVTEHSSSLLRYVLTFPKLNSTALLDRKNLKGMTALHLAAR